MENTTNQKTPLTHLKQFALKSINIQRANTLMRGVEFNGIMYDASPSTISTLTSLVSALKLQSPDMPSTVNWRAIDNSIQTYNIDDLTNLLATMVKFTQKVYEDSWAQKEEINNLTSITELDDYAKNYHQIKN